MLKKHLTYFSLTLILALLLSAVGPTTVFADGGGSTESPPVESSEVVDEITDDETSETQDDEAGGTQTESVSSEDETAEAQGKETGETQAESDSSEDETAETQGEGADETQTESVSSKDETAEAQGKETGETQAESDSSGDEAATVQDDEAQAESEAAKDETLETQTYSESPEVTNLIEQVPDNTEIIIINTEGEAEPLATQEAVDAVATSDPIWCPAGQSPSAGENGCTASFGGFDALLSFLKDNEDDAAYQQAGIIFVEMGTYGGSESTIDLNSYGYNNLNNYDLTIEGGWDTSDDTIDAETGTTFNVSLSIGMESNPWIGSLTFNNISIQDLNNEDALTAYSESDVTLSNVEITNVQNGTAATLVSNDGDVTISDSKFNDSGEGAVVRAGGNVEISNSTFNNNKKGLESENDGFVTLSDVEASNNGKFGANITADDYVDISNSFFSGNKAYVGSYCGGGSYYGYGLQVVTLDAAYLSDVTANDNYLFGAHLDAVTEVDILDSTFNNNGSSHKKSSLGNGLEVESDGLVTVENVEANGNQLYGAILETAGELEVINSTFNDNGKGLQVESSSYVTLSEVEANSNSKFGADITADKSVAISNSFFSGNKAYVGSYCGGGEYYGYGLQVVSLEYIALDEVTANDNYQFGAYLEAGLGVAVSNSTFSNNGSDATKHIDGKGLEVKSGGAVSLFKVEANDNRKFGADITADGFVAVSNSFFSGNKAYVGSYCGGGEYYGYGLQVVSLENVSLNEVAANDNFLFGAYLEADLDVAISNSTFSNNGSDATKHIDGKGLEVKSGGAVSLSNVEANDNRKFGADITADEFVAISNSFFSGNKAYTSCHCGGKTAYGYGLQVVSLENISLDEVAANDNYLFGAYLEAGLDVSVFNSTFSNNGSDATKHIDGKGLEVKSSGAVTLSDVEANDNRKFGADITADKSVAISNSFFSGNTAYVGSYCGGGSYYGYGLQVVTLDATYLSDVAANNNYLFGAYLDAGLDVAISNSTFSNNGSDATKHIDGKGLEVKSGGSVTLSDVEANDNRKFGADITADDYVDISNSFFSGNKAYVGSYCGGEYYGYGLQVVTLDAAYLSEITANDNNLFGAHLDAVTEVDILEGIFNNNGTFNQKNASGDGLQIESDGIVTIELVEASGNYVNGSVVEAVGDVEVIDSTFNNNQKGIGLSVTSSSGEITLDNVTAINNGQDGAYAKTSCNNLYVISGSYSDNGRHGLTVIDSVLNLSDSPSFANNGSDNIFENSSCFSGGDSSDDPSSSPSTGPNRYHTWHWPYGRRSFRSFHHCR